MNYKLRSAKKWDNHTKMANVGYHFGIDLSGNIYEGRCIGVKGSHLTQYNTGVVGIVFFAYDEGFFLTIANGLLIGFFGNIVMFPLVIVFSLINMFWFIKEKKSLLSD